MFMGLLRNLNNVLNQSKVYKLVINKLYMIVKELIK